jgi:hypothetical protein
MFICNHCPFTSRHRGRSWLPMIIEYRAWRNRHIEWWSTRTLNWWRSLLLKYFEYLYDEAVANLWCLHLFLFDNQDKVNLSQATRRQSSWKRNTVKRNDLRGAIDGVLNRNQVSKYWLNIWWWKKKPKLSLFFFIYVSWSLKADHWLLFDVHYVKNQKSKHLNCPPAPRDPYPNQMGSRNVLYHPLLTIEYLHPILRLTWWIRLVLDKKNQKLFRSLMNLSEQKLFFLLELVYLPFLNW